MGKETRDALPGLERNRCGEPIGAQATPGSLPAFVLSALFALSTFATLSAQSLPPLASINPVAESRSGLHFLPLVPRHQGWKFGVGLDYGSMVELNFRTTLADTAYLLDAEVARLSLSASHGLSGRSFIVADVSVGGAYAGHLDGFLNWYHGLFGIVFPERDDRPRNSFAYQYRFPGGRRVSFSRRDAYLGDLRVGWGWRHGDRAQSVVSVTLPTNTAGSGFARGVPSLALLNTMQAPVTPRLLLELSANAGWTPKDGPLEDIQQTTFFLGTAGFRWRTFGGLWSFANLYLHSPYYTDRATASQLERWDLTIDFGWMIRSRSGREFHFGMTEDLWPSGPAVDLAFRLGYAW